MGIVEQNARLIEDACNATRLQTLRECRMVVNAELERPDLTRGRVTNVINRIDWEIAYMSQGAIEFRRSMGRE